MIDISKIDYSTLDRLEAAKFLFNPRPEFDRISVPGSAIRDVLIPVETDVVLGARFHISGKSNTSILFFHGNGEIVADYDDLGRLYTSTGINFLPVDYRGYGHSTGTPTITAMIRDAHAVFDYTLRWLAENGHTGHFVVMGRSLGSASVLELLANYKNMIDGAIIESGFAYSGTLLRLLNITMKSIGLKEEDGFRNSDKILSFDKPTLIIHAEQDHIIPFADGQALYDASPAQDKKLLEIPGANHNDIFLRGMQEYMQAIRWLVKKVNSA